MIVRNDAARLRRCLESCAGVFERTIVVDTGSDDGSPEVAEQLGTDVHHIQWPDAFDAARNYAFDRVDTEWTMYLDSDEWLTPEAPNAIRVALQREDALAYFLLRRNLYREGAWDEMRDLRLWRTDPLLRHQGICHAQLPQDALERAAKGRKLYQSDIAIWHDGYLGGISSEKHERGIRLMRRELELRPGQLYYEIELARTLSLLGRPEGKEMVLHIARGLLQRQDEDQPPVPSTSALLSSALDHTSDADLRGAEADAWIRLLRGWHPDSPVALSATAKALLRKGELQGALRDLLELERMATTGAYDRSLAFDPVVLREGLWTNLALAAHQLGRKDVARRNYLRLLEVDPGHPVARQNLPLL